MSSKRIVDLRQGKQLSQRKPLSFEPRPKRQSQLRVRRRRIRAAMTAMACALLAASVYGLHFGSYAEPLTFHNASIRGTIALANEDVTSFVQSYFAEKSRGYIAETNIFIFHVDDLARAIAQKFHRVKNVQVVRQGFFSNELIVDIEERQTFARWCQGSVEEQTCYALDGNGLVFAPLLSNATSTATTAYWFTGPLATSSGSYATLLPIGGQYAPGHFSGILSLIEELGHKGYGVIYVSTDGGSDVQLYLDTGFSIKVSYGAVPDDVAKNLMLVLNSDVLKNKTDALEYVDLRFGNRVYYKFKSQELNTTP